MILVAILLLDHIDLSTVDNVHNLEEILTNDIFFNIAIRLINISFVFYYLLVMVIVHHLYRITYLYAILSVLIPFVSIFGVAMLIKMI